MLSSPNPDTKRWAHLLAATPILTLTTTWNCCSWAPQESGAPSHVSDRIQFSFTSDPIHTHFSESDIEVAGTSSEERRERDERVWEKTVGISKEEMSNKSQHSSSCRHLLWKKMRWTLLPLSHSVCRSQKPFWRVVPPSDFTCPIFISDLGMDICTFTFPPLHKRGLFGSSRPNHGF